MIIPQLLSWAHYRSMQQCGKSISQIGFCNCDRDHLVDIRYKIAKIKYRYLSVFWCYFCDVVYAMFIRLGILKYRFQICRGFHAAPALLHSCTPALLHDAGGAFGMVSIRRPCQQPRVTEPIAVLLHPLVAGGHGGG
ncbi:hypothetical protein [Aeromonas caviae]|uniref:hypothetical protein n=1 Tax=Aeromonas caviae TaxID=648 RepID=UPI003F74A464